MNLRQRIEQRITDLRVERDIAAAAADPSESYSNGKWVLQTDDRYDGYHHWDEWYIAGARVPLEMEATATHIATQDPATVIARIDRELAGCAADLALLDQMDDRDGDFGPITGVEQAAQRGIEARYPEGDNA